MPNVELDFTMPLTTVSGTAIRSVSIEDHPEPDNIEKWVRYLAKYQYKVSYSSNELIDTIMCYTIE